MWHLSSLPCHVRQKLGSLSLSPSDFSNVLKYLFAHMLTWINIYIYSDSSCSFGTHDCSKTFIQLQWGYIQTCCYNEESITNYNQKSAVWLSLALKCIIGLMWSFWDPDLNRSESIWSQDIRTTRDRPTTGLQVYGKDKSHQVWFLN